MQLLFLMFDRWRGEKILPLKPAQEMFPENYLLEKRVSVHVLEANL